VKLIAGDDKGKTGKVMSVFPHAAKIVIEGLNMRKKHIRPRRQGQKGEVVSVPAAVPVSRVMIVCGKCGKATRIGASMTGGKKIRVCGVCGEAI
jgi:large subunit ribosomal protein L24